MTDEEMGKVFRALIERADFLRSLGLMPSQVQTTPGPAGFLERIAAQLADVECECGMGLEHFRGDHAELEEMGHLKEPRKPG
jgi:hypothetical protein